MRVRHLLAIAALCACNPLIGLDEGYLKDPGATGAGGGSSSSTTSEGGGPTGSGGAGAGGAGGSGGSGGAGGSGECTGTMVSCDAASPDCETDLLTSGDHCGACGHSCNGDACSEGQCPVVVITALASNPVAVVVDDPFVYWTNWSGDYAVGRALKTDSWATPELVGEGATPAAGLAVDFFHVYWSEYFTGNVTRKPTADLALPAETIATGEDNPWLMARGSGEVVWCSQAGVRRFRVADGDLATLVPYDATSIAHHGGSVYWTQTAQDGMPAKVAMWTLEQSLVELVGEEICSGNACPRGIAAGDAGVFYTHYTTPSGGGAVKRASPDPAVLAAGQEEPWQVVIDGEFLYWTNAHETSEDGEPTIGSVWRMPIAGGAPLRLATSISQPRGIAVDDAWVYWADHAGTSINRVAK